MSKYTTWFDPVKEPPVRVGWYPVKWKKIECFWQRQFHRPRMHWDGRAWSDVVLKDDDETTVRMAFKSRSQICVEGFKGFKWRGLTEPRTDYKGK